MYQLPLVVRKKIKNEKKKKNEGKNLKYNL